MPAKLLSAVDVAESTAAPSRHIRWRALKEPRGTSRCFVQSDGSLSRGTAKTAMFEHSESKPILAQHGASSDALSETELASAASFAGPRRASTTNLEQSLQDAGSSSAGSSSPRSRSSVAPATIVERGAGVCIGALLNLMLCVPFALAYFPIEWHPFPVPRAMGCSMYFLSTVIAQVVLTFQSGFATAQGQMMVENIRVVHARRRVAGGGPCPRRFPSWSIQWAPWARTLWEPCSSSGPSARSSSARRSSRSATSRSGRSSTTSRARSLSVASAALASFW